MLEIGQRQCIIFKGATFWGQFGGHLELDAIKHFVMHKFGFLDPENIMLDNKIIQINGKMSQIQPILYFGMVYSLTKMHSLTSLKVVMTLFGIHILDMCARDSLCKYRLHKFNILISMNLFCLCDHKNALNDPKSILRDRIGDGSYPNFDSYV